MFNGWGRLGEVERVAVLKVFVIHVQWGSVGEVEPNKQLGEGTHHINRAEPFAAQTETLLKRNVSAPLRRLQSSLAALRVEEGSGSFFSAGPERSSAFTYGSSVFSIDAK